MVVVGGAVRWWWEGLWGGSGRPHHDRHTAGQQDLLRWDGAAEVVGGAVGWLWEGLHGGSGWGCEVVVGGLIMTITQLASRTCSDGMELLR